MRKQTTTTKGKANKRKSYLETLKTSGTVKELIHNYLKAHGPATRAEIAQKLRLKDSSVCARLNELQKAGLITESGDKFDTATERQVTVYTALQKAA